MITVNADERPEGIGLRIQTVQSLEEQAVNMQSALRVYVRDSGPLKAVASHLNAAGDGQVSFVVIKEDGQARDRGRTAGALPDFAADRLGAEGRSGRRRRRTGVSRSTRRRAGAAA